MPSGTACVRAERSSSGTLGRRRSQWVWMYFGKRSVLFVETANERVRLQLPGLSCGENYKKPRWDWKLRSKSEDPSTFRMGFKPPLDPRRGAVTPGGQGRGTRGEFLKRGQDNQEFVRAVNLEKEERFVEAERICREVLTRHPDNVSALRLWARPGTRTRMRRFKVGQSPQAQLTESRHFKRS